MVSPDSVCEAALQGCEFREVGIMGELFGGNYPQPCPINTTVTVVPTGSDSHWKSKEGGEGNMASLGVWRGGHLVLAQYLLPVLGTHHLTTKYEALWALY